MLDIQFQHLEKHHLPLLVKWLNEPHVWQWWGEGKKWALHDVETKYGSYLLHYKIDQGIKKPIYPFIIFHNAKPIGYIQHYNAFDFPREGFEVQDIWEGPSSSLAALDFYIGEPSCLGKGIGSTVLSEYLDKYVYKQFSACLVDPEKDNLRAIRSYEKAGFTSLYERGNLLIMIAKS